jgi:hypothetical protein
MANAVRIKLRGDTVSGGTGDYIETATYASPAAFATAAATAVSSGGSFIAVTPRNSSGIGGSTDESDVVVNLAAVVVVVQI